MKRRQLRYPALKKATDGTNLCRGCGAPVPKGRQTWCSRECYKDRCPQLVRLATWQRDQGVCQICFILIGDPKFTHRWRWECDHIIPHSEGGEMILENMRVLCVKCHKERTKQWHIKRVMALKEQVQPSLL